HTDETVTLSGGVVPESSAHGPLVAGSYSFIAVYSGDSNYAGSTGAVEPLTVNMGTSSTATTIENFTSDADISAAVPLGTTVNDSTTVTGSPAAFTPTGTVTYEFFTTIDVTGPHTDETVTLSGGVVPESS